MTVEHPDREPEDQSEFDIEFIEPVALPQGTIRNRAARNADIAFKEPAIGSFSARGRDELAQLSLDNGLGTPRPPRLRVGFGQGKNLLVMLPTTSADAQAIPVSYSGRSVTINLYDYFASIDRFVPPDRREYFRLYRSPRPVSFGDLKGHALILKLKEYTSEPINHLSEEEKARRQAKRKRQDTAAGEDTEPKE